MVNDILEIASVGTVAGQLLINRWHFVNPAGGVDPAPVLPAFVTDVLQPYAAAATTDVRWTALLWRIITDPLSPQNEYLITPDLVGVSGNAGVPSIVAVTCRWSLGPTTILAAEVPQGRVRRGGKRFAGLDDAGVVVNALTSPARGRYELVAEGYLGMAVSGYLPCVAGFPKRPPKGTDPDNPLLSVPNKFCRITGFGIKGTVGSQVSRKPGHGR